MSTTTSSTGTTAHEHDRPQRTAASTTATVVLVQNAGGSGPRRLLEWLAAEGLTTRLLAAHDGEPLPADLAGVDGLVLLGGGLLPDDDVRAPWLAEERRLVGDALATDVPLLGICLGAQLLAHVGGGVVTGSSGETERGSCAVRLLPAAGEDPLFAPLAGEQLQMIQNHRDSITTAPPEAVLLATSEICPVQAFRLGERAWGVQFHPEAGAERLSSWDESALSAQGFDRDQLLAEATRHAESSTRQSRLLVAGFAEQVRRRAQTRTGGRRPGGMG